jgi:hypothetical protein
MATEQAANTVRPTGGIRRFRERCGLAVDAGDLVVSDYRGRKHRFRLDASESAPASYVYSVGGPWWAIVDRRGQAIVSGVNEQWDSTEIEDLTEPAGIASVVHGGSQAPPLRNDGVVLEEPGWAKWSLPIVGGSSAASLAIASAAQQRFIPVWTAVAFFVVIWGLFLRAWMAGALAPPRPGKSWPETQKIIEEYAGKREPAWQPPLPPKWRLAAEFQFGTYFLLSLVTLIRSHFMAAFMAVVVSLVLFGMTHWMMSHSRFWWWCTVVIINVAGVLTLVATLFDE